MSTLSLPFRRLASTHAAGSATQPLPIWQLIVQQFGTGLAVGAIVVGALTGVDAAVGLMLPGDMLVVAGLCFLLLYAGEGLALLGRLAVVALLRVLKVSGMTKRSGISLAVTAGRLVGASVLLYGHVVFPNSFLTHVTVSVVGQFILPAIALSWCVAGVALRSPGRQPIRLALLGVAALPVLAVGGWLLAPGFDDYLPPTPAPAPVAALPFENPGEPGSYRVQTLSYGSGLDRWQPQYGADAALPTTAVDGSSLFAGFGFADGYLSWRRGYDFTQMPLNGLVWYPAGVGPFPLVLMVHGAHNAFEASEPGYAYLGEHLASRGYIAVSVDENFLNGSALGDGEGREVAARAWLLLKHLQVWRAWNGTPSNPFFGQVDLDRIALIGHSRGGEAVAAAAELNRHDHAPVPAEPYNFGIRAVVALAPSDWFYQPNGKLLTLKDTNYLVLGGGHDADTFTFYGLAQYNRTHLTEGSDEFRALVYLYQANHGQFNSVWGDHDRGYIGSFALNRRPLMSGADQRQAAKVYITGFLEAAINERAEYRALFYRAGAAQAWAPGSAIVTAYQDATFMPVATFEKVLRRDTGDVTGSTTQAENMASWGVEALHLRDNSRLQNNGALHLTWHAGLPATYQVNLPPGAATEWALTERDALTFNLTLAGAADAAFELLVELQDAANVQVQLPLSQFGAPPSLLPAQLVKADWLMGAAGYNMTIATPFERVPQTYDVPLAAFRQAEPRFQFDQIVSLRFNFDGAQGGDLYLDAIGFRRAP